MNKKERREQARAAAAEPTPSTSADQAEQELQASTEQPSTEPDPLEIIRKRFDGVFGNVIFARVRGDNKPAEYKDRKTGKVTALGAYVESRSSRSSIRPRASGSVGSRWTGCRPRRRPTRTPRRSAT